MEHLLAVGTVTDAAKAVIERVDGRVWRVSDAPSCSLVQLPHPRFEYEHYEKHVIRIKLQGGGSLIWQGDYDGPELTSVEQTRLYAESGEPVEEVEDTSDYLDDLGDLDDHPF